MNDGVLLTGNLSEIRLPTLLMSLYRDKETGVLTLEDDRFKKALYIKDGTVVYATSTDPDERLGECLLRRGLITLQQYEDSADQVIQGRRQGRVLVDMGALTPSELVEGVTQQLYDIIFSLFQFRSGTYTLELAPFSTLEMITLAIEIPAVIFKGMCRLNAWSQMRPLVREASMRLRTCASQPPFLADLELHADQEQILRISRQGLTIASILEASYLPQFETLRTLWIFLTLGLMEREDQARQAQAGAAQDPEALIDQYNDVYEYIHHHLSAQGGGEAGLQALVADMKKIHGSLGAGQEDLIRFGKLDMDVALLALRTIPEADRTTTLQAFLEEVLYAMVLEADRRLPADRREALHSYLRRRAGGGP